MSTEITKTEKKLMPVNDMLTMAKLFAESGMFQDAKQVAQAFVKIQAGQEIGLAPFAAMSGINIILGKPTFGAGVIASCVKGNGKYDYLVKEMNEKICSIDFFEGAKLIGNSTFTIEDAKKQLTKNLDKFPKNMLFARAMSNGQKWFCPDVFQMSVYVPEEMPDVTENINHTVVSEPIANVVSEHLIETSPERIAVIKLDVDIIESVKSLEGYFKGLITIEKNNTEIKKYVGAKKVQLETSTITTAE